MKLENFILDFLKKRETPSEEKMESYSTRNLCAKNDQSFIESVTSCIDQKWSAPTEALCVGNERNDLTGSRFSADISNHLPNINIQRTEFIHIESPVKFYVKNENVKINQLELNKFADLTTTASTVDMKTVYLVQKGNDINWYRAKVYSKHNDTELLMVFIDYGFKYVVEKNK